jgi:hypothetical protein
MMPHERVDGVRVKPVRWGEIGKEVSVGVELWMEI